MNDPDTMLPQKICHNILDTASNDEVGNLSGATDAIATCVSVTNLPLDHDRPGLNGVILNFQSLLRRIAWRSWSYCSHLMLLRNNVPCVELPYLLSVELCTPSSVFIVKIQIAKLWIRVRSKLVTRIGRPSRFSPYATPCVRSAATHPRCRVEEWRGAEGIGE